MNMQCDKCKAFGTIVKMGRCCSIAQRVKDDQQNSGRKPESDAARLRGTLEQTKGK